MSYLVLTQAQCFFAKFGTTCTMSTCPCQNRTLPTTRGSGYYVHVSISKQNSTNYYAHVSVSKQDSSNYQR